jgi:hypothetical protein
MSNKSRWIEEIPHESVAKPCANCPFRSDIKPYQRPIDVVENARSMLLNQPAACHCTVYNTDGTRKPSEDVRICAGWLTAMNQTAPGLNPEHGIPVHKDYVDLILMGTSFDQSKEARAKAYRENVKKAEESEGKS